MSEGKVSDPVYSSTETGSSSPGAVLRRCREFHGITLEDAAETTKIGVSYLRSLENNQISEFANQAYLKGFLRIYATYLGLNFDDIAPMYDKLSGVQADKPDRVRTSSSSPRPARRFALLKKMLFPFFLLMVIIITATFFKRPPAPPVIQPQPPPFVAPPREEAAVQQIQSSVRIIKTEKVVSLPKAEVISPVPSEAEKSVTLHQSPADVPKGFILKIRATQNGALTSNVDDSGPQKYEITIGDVIEWKAEKKVTLELSNAGGVDVELNGKPYKPLGPPGRPAYVELDASGVKE